ncbi:MAG: hypothetical protein Q7W45_16005 [Bacteroidota bacterium]|nr:hypothetical protein [Bacteroidota bacterium]MDP3145480.1 hypothetical protein [Bacteroidota bacterium]MDP3556436.1 hypothetical protein [Bacteroidota bacterium]
MKKQFLIISGLAIISASIIFSCKKKGDDNRITPTYKEDATGTGGNPNVGNQTVTGTATITNPATQNSSLLVGGAGWSNPTCISTNSITLKGLNGSIEVTLSFLFPPTSGTYAIAASPNAQACSMTVLNAPNQPAGLVWYGKTGQVVVNTTTTAINASFTGVQCTQQNFNFPAVGVSGNLGCN